MRACRKTRRQFPQTIRATNATRADNKRRQRFNCKTPAATLNTFANDPTAQGQTQPLQTIPPAWTIPVSLPATDCTDRQRPLAWTVSAVAIRANWATFPRFPPDICGRTRPRAPALLRARLHIYTRMYEFLHIRNENYIPYSTCTRKALILLAFKARALCNRRKKVFTLGKSARKALIFLRLRALHNQPIYAFLTIYHYINSNLCGSRL